jgi:hypothetical protein
MRKNKRKTMPGSKEKYQRLVGSTIQCDVSVTPIVYKGKQGVVINNGVNSKEVSS